MLFYNIKLLTILILKKFFFFIFLLFLLISSIEQLKAAEIILNPSFEDFIYCCIFTHWDLTKIGWFKCDDEPWHTDGVRSCRIYSKSGCYFNLGDYASLSQKVNLSNVKEICFDIRLEQCCPIGGTWRPFFEAAVFIGNIKAWTSQSTQGTGVYLNQSVDVSQLTGEYYIEFRLQTTGAGSPDGSHWFYFDNLRVITSYIGVDIDIKPGSEPNCFNNNGNGVIPVAILGSLDYDIYKIDPGTVKLEGLSVKAVSEGDKLLSHYEDVNGDDLDDLVVQIQDEDNIFQVGDTTATVTGNLYDDYGGKSIGGSDSICIVQ